MHQGGIVLDSSARVLKFGGEHKPYKTGLNGCGEGRASQVYQVAIPQAWARVDFTFTAELKWQLQI